MTEGRIARRATLALLALAGMWSVTGRAEEVLLSSSPLVNGSLASATPFSVPGAGTVSVTLTDLDWPTKLASLTFAATTPGAVMDSMRGAGSTSFKVETPGVYSAVVGAVASPGFLNLGWFSMRITFAPAVPLPASIWLLLSALGALAALQVWKETKLQQV